MEDSIQLREPNSLPERRTLSEDFWAVSLGAATVLAALIATWFAGDFLTGWINKPGEWDENPVDSFMGAKAKVPVWTGTMVALGVIGLLLAVLFSSRRELKRGMLAYVGISILAVAATVMSGQAVVKYYNLEYVLWAIVLGFVIGNTVGIPSWLRPAVRGELFIKLGLVLLGMEVLMGKLFVLGLPGILVSWVVTPIVLVTTFWFGRRVLRMESPSLVITVAADMSVCGVSAAIATAAACKAKKEELSLAISLSLAFTAVMMVVMPIAIRAIGMDDIVGGAWIGGTIDSTGAVAASGAALGDRALKIASTVKMIQNILIGVIAFSVSVYWAATYGHSQPGGEPSIHTVESRGFFAEVWSRFPKFVLGFLSVSIVASVIDYSGESGAGLIKQSIDFGHEGTAQLVVLPRIRLHRFRDENANVVASDAGGEADDLIPCRTIVELVANRSDGLVGVRLAVSRVDHAMVTAMSFRLSVAQQTRSKRIQLVIAASIFLFIWCVLLPKIGRIAGVKEWIDPLRQQGINPSGMYYTDVFEKP